MVKQKLRLGTVAFSPKGKWNAETEYKRLNVVHFLASSYYAKKENVGQTPTLDSEYWGLLVEGGDVVNNPDEEDITTEVVNNEHVLKLADKEYRPENYSGKGYKRLRKNIQKINLAVTKITVNSAPTKDGEISVTINNIDTHISLVNDTHNTPAIVAQTISDALVSAHTDYNIEVTENIITLTRKHSGEVASSAFDVADTGVTLVIEDSTKSAKRNILTPAMINQPNTIYEIRYDFDLDGGTVNIPENCTLKFEGGSLKNGTIIANNTSIKGCANCLSKVDAITGTIFEGINLSWIGVYKNNQDNSKNIKKLKNISSNVFIVDTDITLYEPDVILPKNVKLLGFGHNITYNCESCNKGLLILSESCYLENLNIKSSSQKYNGVIVLADTEINKVHTFKLNNVEITGQWNSSKDYKSTALKINASNFEDNSDNYITACQLHGIRIAWVNIGIEFTCINNNYPSSKSFAWLNEVYINTLYISALSYGIKTYFADNATNNRTDSVGPLYCSQFEFQALSNKAVMFKHSGHWTLNINTGFCWDSDYKGIITSGTVNVSSIFGGYKIDGTYTDDSGVSYKLVDSVKVYGGKYNILSGNNKTPDSYREECYDPFTDVNKWIVGCENSDFVFNRRKNNLKRYFSSPDGFYFSDHIKTEGPNISKSLYTATGGGCVELTYAKRYAQDEDFVILNTNCHFVGRNIEIISTGSNNEFTKLYIQHPIKKGEIYKGKIKVLFKDKTYKEYKENINFLNTSALPPLQRITSMENLTSRYIVEEDNLFIEFEAECIENANGFSLILEFFYARRINKNSKWIFNFDNLPNIKIPLEAFVYRVEIDNFTYYKKIGNTESRPSNIQKGFQFFDTTLNKPIWWTGTKWVDATGADV